MNLDWLPEELESVVYRIARADQCLYQLMELITYWGRNEPLDLTQRQVNDLEVEVVVKSVRPIPPLVSLLFGEAINHLRSSLDNTVWYLTEKEHGRLLFKDAIKVEFPIRQDSQKFCQWQRDRKKAKLHALGGPSQLAERIQALQPFEDVSQAIPSASEFLADLWGEESDLRHPLLLLQEYSNEDKHRQLRLGLSRANSSTTLDPLLSQDLRFRVMESGSVLGKYPVGAKMMLDANVTIMIRRPGQHEVWVSPVKELNALRRYVADVAIPSLLKGIALTGTLPPDVDLGDCGKTFEERVSAASGRDAEARFEPIRNRLLAEAYAEPPKLLPGEIQQD